MSRLSIRAAKSTVAAYVASNGGSVSLSCVATGKAGNPSFAASVTYGGGTIQLAGDSGKIKSFPTVEAAILAFSQIREANDGVYAPSVDTGELFASKVPSNIYTAAASRIVSLNKSRAMQITRRDALAALLAGPMLGWDTGNAAQVASFNETTTQKAVIVSDIAAIDAEIVAQQAVVDSAP